MSKFKKAYGFFCPRIPKWTWGVMYVGCLSVYRTVQSLFQNFKLLAVFYDCIQSGLCHTWSEPQIVVFLMQRVN